MNESYGDPTLAYIFERLIEIEYKASKLYAELSKLFSHVSDISDFWRELVKDEIFHMNTLQEIHKSLTEEGLILLNHNWDMHYAVWKLICKRVSDMDMVWLLFLKPQNSF